MLDESYLHFKSACLWRDVCTSRLVEVVQVGKGVSPLQVHAAFQRGNSARLGRKCKEIEVNNDGRGL